MYKKSVCRTVFALPSVCYFGVSFLVQSKFFVVEMCSGLVAIVTGAARGIGLSISEKLLDLSYRVILFDVREEEGKEAETKLQKTYGKNNVAFIKGSVSSKLELKAAFEKAGTFFKRIDLLINNAAVVAEPEPGSAVAVNLVGPIYGCELALEYMGISNKKKGGVVINVSSISGLLPYPDTPAYVAAKHGLIGLTRSYGHDVHFQKNGVTFMAICPYYVDTKILEEAVTLKVCNPQNVKSMLMSIGRVKQGIKKLLDDKRNGSILLVLPDSMEYVEIPENLRKIPTTII